MAAEVSGVGACSDVVAGSALATCAGEPRASAWATTGVAGAGPGVGVKSTCSGFGRRSFKAPLVASTPMPISPPTNMLPANPAPPAPDMPLVTVAVAVWNPGLLTVTVKPVFLGM